MSQRSICCCTDLGDQDTVLLLVLFDGLFKLHDELFDLIAFHLLGAGFALQSLQLVSERLDSFQHVSIADLRDHPFHLWDREKSIKD